MTIILSTHFKPLAKLLEFTVVNTICVIVQIYDQGYSRVPVYESTRDNVVGLLLVKMLIRTDVCEKKTIRSMVSSLLAPRFCLKVTPLYTALNQFFIVKSKSFHCNCYHVIFMDCNVYCLLDSPLDIVVNLL